ncbi:MAG: tRNA threonylcarbamoyladenosine dehydratase [Marinifilaceae bacterium]|jgi:tRNA A37 threonylcarbamoyladenosine dehydratase|nr:tRNA threonylcarbamoyladenosine dehydratase [Marinifilaceae bacterium]
MNNWLSRAELFLGEENILKLKNSHVLIVGLGGVGGSAAEQICRAGVGKLTIIDGDIVEESNINRQIVALRSTIGKKKAEILKDRLLDINPEIEIISISDYMNGEKFEKLLQNKYDYIIDAIDTLSPKVNLIKFAVLNKHRIVSSMGAGGKYDLEKIKVAPIAKSKNCTLARAVRKRLNREGIRKGVKVVFSEEFVKKDSIVEEDGRNKASNVGTISYMPSVFGAFCASVVIRDILDLD